MSQDLIDTQVIESTNEGEPVTRSDRRTDTRRYNAPPFSSDRSVGGAGDAEKHSLVLSGCATRRPPVRVGLINRSGARGLSRALRTVALALYLLLVTVRRRPGPELLRRHHDRAYCDCNRRGSRGAADLIGVGLTPTSARCIRCSPWIRLTATRESVFNRCAQPEATAGFDWNNRPRQPLPRSTTHPHLDGRNRDNNILTVNTNHLDGHGNHTSRRDSLCLNHWLTAAALKGPGRCLTGHSGQALAGCPNRCHAALDLGSPELLQHVTAASCEAATSGSLGRTTQTGGAPLRGWTR